MRRHLALAGLALGLFAALFIVETLRAGGPWDPVELAGDLLETALLVGAVVMTARVAVELGEVRRERRDLVADLSAARREGERWRTRARNHLDGLSRAIAAQFDAWQLTPAEADVASLMLKGLSHREIAALRQTSEPTVRQHAAAVYRKSGLASRAQLTGFFLEDLLAPEPERAAAGPLVIVGRDQG